MTPYCAIFSKIWCCLFAFNWSCGLIVAAGWGHIGLNLLYTSLFVYRSQQNCVRFLILVKIETIKVSKE